MEGLRGQRDRELVRRGVLVELHGRSTTVPGRHGRNFGQELARTNKRRVHVADLELKRGRVPPATIVRVFRIETDLNGLAEARPRVDPVPQRPGDDRESRRI